MIENSLIDPAVTQTQSGTSVLKRAFAAQKALDDVQFENVLVNSLLSAEFSSAGY